MQAKPWVNRAILPSAVDHAVDALSFVPVTARLVEHCLLWTRSFLMQHKRLWKSQLLQSLDTATHR